MSGIPRSDRFRLLQHAFGVLSTLYPVADSKRGGPSPRGRTVWSLRPPESCGGLQTRTDSRRRADRRGVAFAAMRRGDSARMVGGVAGLLGFVLALAGFSALGDTPDPHDPAGSVAAY